MTALSISRRDARRSALQGLIDYAGLFPPAGLDMAAAVAGYRAARTGGQAWLVDRFICPGARLEELVAVLAPTMAAGEEPWRLSVTASGWTDTLTADAGSVLMFGDTVGAAAVVDLVEIRVPDEVAADPDRLLGEAHAVLRAYPARVLFELPWRIPVRAAMEVLARLRAESGRALGVKLRCGGLAASQFPSPEEGARFISVAAALKLPMKATAGLHHPYRALDQQTGFRHHGFLNVLVATALAHRGESESALAAVLADEDVQAFNLDRSGLTWRGTGVTAVDLDGMRGELFLAYGSCSFDEPVADLISLGVLPVAE